MHTSHCCKSLCQASVVPRIAFQNRNSRHVRSVGIRFDTSSHRSASQIASLGGGTPPVPFFACNKHLSETGFFESEAAFASRFWVGDIPRLLRPVYAPKHFYFSATHKSAMPGPISDHDSCHLLGQEPEDSKKNFITREEEPDQYAPS